MMPSRAGSLIERYMLLRRGRVAFLATVPFGGTLLDAGCGNNSPTLTKRHRPDIHYIGLDVGDYNQPVPPSMAADEYIVTTPEGFAGEIERYAGRLDAVISAHNLEHCHDPEAVVRAMAGSLKRGGRMYLSFPCEASTTFPQRRGTLNFHGDPGHTTVPRFDEICSSLQSHGLHIDYASRRYRPLLLSLLGLLLEPASILLKKNMPLGSTWALYGFESVIWASRAGSGFGRGT